MFDAVRDAPLTKDVELWNKIDLEDNYLDRLDGLDGKSDFGRDLSVFYDHVLTSRRSVQCKTGLRVPAAGTKRDAENIPCINASYDDRFLRAPREGELACDNGDKCVGRSPEIKGHDKHLGFTLVEFRTPHAMQQHSASSSAADRKPGLCVLCTRLAVSTLFIKGLPGTGGESDAAFYDQINSYCNLIDQPDGYRSDLALPPAGHQPNISSARIVGSVVYLKFAHLAWKCDAKGEWWVDQSRMKYIPPKTVCLQHGSKRAKTTDN